VAAALDALTKEVKELKLKSEKCEMCRGGHATSECPLIHQEEQVDFVGDQNCGSNNSYGNSYNPGWRNHPNFSWKSSGNPPGFSSNSTHNQGQGQYSGGNSGNKVGSGIEGGLGKIEELLTQLVAKDAHTQKTLAEHDTLLKNPHSAFLDLQRTVGDIARRLEERPQGQFSGSTQPNRAAQLKAVTTRSGRGAERVSEQVESEVEEQLDEEIEMEAPSRVQPRLVPASTAPNSEPRIEKVVGRTPTPIRPTPEIDPSRLPYPARLRNQKYAKEYGHFLDMFKQLKINLPFIEALQHMPKYAKFLKDLLKRKDRLGEVSNIPLTAGCSAVVLNKLPEKLTDPGIFTIPCMFGSDTQNHALADLGASINLMPYSLYEKLDLGDLTPTRMTLSLADRSVKYPRGIVENLLVKVDKFVFPVDFVILDMEVDDKVPLILGRPFLRTAKALIDVFDGKITLRVGDETVTFEIVKSMRYPGSQDDFSGPTDSVYFINSFISRVDLCLYYIRGVIW
jgi:hypothetical protein